MSEKKKDDKTVIKVKMALPPKEAESKWPSDVKSTKKSDPVELADWAKKRLPKHTFRMYGLVPYQLSGIQAGIQYGHAVVEYGLENANSSDYVQWAKKDKTFVVLNGGSSNSRRSNDSPEHPEYVGTLNNHLALLENAEVTLSTFYEPDLQDMLTAIVFLVDNRVFDRETFPDWEFERKFPDWMRVDPDGVGPRVYYGNEEAQRGFDEWKSKFGEDADQVVFMRDFLRPFKLAGT